MTAPDSSSLSPQTFENLDIHSQTSLAETALRLAKKAGAGYADIRIGRNQDESAYAREDKLQHFNSTFSAGFGVRVLLEGSWGFAGSRSVSEAEVVRATAEAIANAKAARLLQTRPIELEDTPAYRDAWTMPVAADPFTVPVEEKAAKLLGINAAALKAGADYCSSQLWIVREEKLFASSRGSHIHQSRVRIWPEFTVTAIDKQTGRFATRDSLYPARAAGWEYVAAYDGEAEAALAATQAREKLAAKSVEPGQYDVVIDPANLFLTIHESVGHSTELDRALGWEADFAGTSFVVPEMLDGLPAHDGDGRPLAGRRPRDDRL